MNTNKTPTARKEKYIEIARNLVDDKRDFASIFNELFNLIEMKNKFFGAILRDEKEETTPKNPGATVEASLYRLCEAFHNLAWRAERVSEYLETAINEVDNLK